MSLFMALRNQPQEAYELLDKRDEEQILAEIKGNIITEMFYSFKMEGREVTGISWVGTKEIARQYGGINIDYVDLKETPSSYMAIVKATDTKRGTSLLGTAMQPKTMNTRNGEVDDKFASTKAISKAQRNAIRAIIPERFLIEMYEQFKKGTEPTKPEPRKKVEAEAKPVDKPKWDPDEQTVVTTLEVHGLDPQLLTIYKYGKAVKAQPKDGFPQDKWSEYEAVMKLLKATWDGSLWEMPIK